MNEPEFEEQLRAIRPAAPRRAVEDRIAAEIGRAPTVGTLQPPARSLLARLLPGLGWSAAGAAIGIATMLALGLTQERLPAQSNSVTSTQASSAEATEIAASDMELEHEVLDVEEQGIVDGTDAGPSRLVRYESMERRRWSDGTGAVTVLEVPREDLVLIPVSFQ
jgi:hypothetical protein